jgi:transposase
MAANQRRYDLSESEWDRVKHYFELAEAPKKGRGRPPADPRTTLNGVIWIAKSGAPWRDLPSRYGPYTTVYTWYAKWQESGIFQKILEDLGVEADLQDMSIDSTSVKVHQHAAGAKKGSQLT